MSEPYPPRPSPSGGKRHYTSDLQDSLPSSSAARHHSPTWQQIAMSEPYPPRPTLYCTQRRHANDLQESLPSLSAAIYHSPTSQHTTTSEPYPPRPSPSGTQRCHPGDLQDPLPSLSAAIYPSPTSQHTAMNGPHHHRPIMEHPYPASTQNHHSSTGYASNNYPQHYPTLSNNGPPSFQPPMAPQDSRYPTHSNNGPPSFERPMAPQDSRYSQPGYNATFSDFPHHDNRTPLLGPYFPASAPSFAAPPLQRKHSTGKQTATRMRTAIACMYCRRRKIRCTGFNADGSRGQCVNCIRFEQECIFTPVSSQQAFVPVQAMYAANGGTDLSPHVQLFGAHGQPLPMTTSPPSTQSYRPRPQSYRSPPQSTFEPQIPYHKFPPAPGFYHPSRGSSSSVSPTQPASQQQLPHHQHQQMSALPRPNHIPPLSYQQYPQTSPLPHLPHTRSFPVHHQYPLPPRSDIPSLPSLSRTSSQPGQREASSGSGSPSMRSSHWDVVIG
ncbi:putative C6 transcription factor [Sclerotinia borealis F-4128]|uniref:Putative C6 transcription factor n=1 Tax=Sclerotinia borealis (strain F-4128) TaxID=1432307 RepID=W9CR16_SCLBF|nr:putative C6 transcription factor [Sclerotinia borealis F-4128]